ncbi:hypothetical protein LJC46_01290 [Desulfovibrio sp. OttesenSCG-928-G15]|nr:hypothetical protein [Desulfovibrio sp. OttesenSCG-928-G15]
MNEGLKRALGSAAAAGQMNRVAQPGQPERTGSVKRRSGKKASGKNQGGKAPGLFVRMADLYARMEKAYDASAKAAGLTCEGCPTNCCTSYFRHHTYIEWAYLWRGLSALPDKECKRLVARAEQYLQEAGQTLALGGVPTAMCPLNERGLCVLYPYRLMICRMHGTRNVFSLPDGTQQTFSGCARFTAMHGQASGFDGSSASFRADACGSGSPASGPVALDRTPFYSELAALEREFRLRCARQLPRVDMTLAEMMVAGPPRFQ